MLVIFSPKEYRWVGTKISLLVFIRLLKLT